MRLLLIIGGDCTLNQLFDASRSVKIFSIKEDCTGNAEVTFEGSREDLSTMRVVYCTAMHVNASPEIIRDEIDNWPIYDEEEVLKAPE